MTEREALKLALEALDKHDYEMADHILWKALSQPEQEPVAWLQFRDNEPPVVAPRNLGTPVFLGIRGGLAHDAGEKP